MSSERSYRVGQTVSLFRYVGLKPIVAAIDLIHADGSVDLSFHAPGNTYHSRLYKVPSGEKKIGVGPYFVFPGV